MGQPDGGAGFRQLSRMTDQPCALRHRVDGADDIPPICMLPGCSIAMGRCPHGAARVMQNFCRHGAEQGGAETALAARGKHDEIVFPDARQFRDAGTGSPSSTTVRTGIPGIPSPRSGSAFPPALSFISSRGNSNTTGASGVPYAMAGTFHQMQERERSLESGARRFSRAEPRRGCVPRNRLGRECL